MPIYEYKCTNCDGEFEKLVFSSDEQVQCPRCGSTDVRKLMSACGFKSGGEFSPSGGSGGCASCAGGNCATCH